MHIEEVEHVTDLCAFALPNVHLHDNVRLSMNRNANDNAGFHHTRCKYFLFANKNLIVLHYCGLYTASTSFRFPSK